MQQSNLGLLWRTAPAIPAALLFIVVAFPDVNSSAAASKSRGHEMEVFVW
jgi:hypothetical protein